MALRFLQCAIISGQRQKCQSPECCLNSPPEINFIVHKFEYNIFSHFSHWLALIQLKLLLCKFWPSFFFLSFWIGYNLLSAICSYPSVYTKEFCKHEIYHCHEILGYHNSKLLSVNTLHEYSINKQSVFCFDLPCLLCEYW